MQTASISSCYFKIPEVPKRRALQVLTKIDKYLKKKFLAEENYALTIDELLLKTKQSDISKDVKMILIQDVLPNHPKIEVTQDQKFMYKPPLPCRDGNSLLQLLKRRSNGGVGTIMDEISDSVPCAESILRSLLQKELVIVVNRSDKKEIVFYKNSQDEATQFKVDDIFKEWYRSMNVGIIDIINIERYLKRNKLQPLEVAEKIPVNHPKPLSKKRRTKSLKDNCHIAHKLENYRDTDDKQSEEHFP